MVKSNNSGWKKQTCPSQDMFLTIKRYKPNSAYIVGCTLMHPPIYTIKAVH